MKNIELVVIKVMRVNERVCEGENNERRKGEVDCNLSKYRNRIFTGNNACMYYCNLSLLVVQ